MKFFKVSEDKDQPFRIARIFSYHLYEELVLRYVDSSTVEEFMNIDWARSSGVITFVNCTYGEVLKTRWEELLGIINKSNSLNRFPIIAEIQRKIYQTEESTRQDKERDEIFD